MSDESFDLDANVNLGVEPVEDGMFASEEDKEGLVRYLREEHESVSGGEERGALEQKWIEWRRKSEGRPEQETKSYPWENASNVVVPITMNATHGIFAMLKNIFGNREKFWKVEDTKGNAEHGRVLSDTLNFLANSKDHLDLRSANNTIFYDVARMGTQFVKVPWITDSVTFKRRRAGSVETVTRTRRNSPAVIPIRLEDFLTRPYWYDIQRAPWIAHRIWLMEHELLQRAQQMIYDPEAVEEVIAHGAGELDASSEAALRRQGIEASGDDVGMYEIDEMYVYFDIDGDGIPEDVIVWLHPDSGAVLRVDYNDLSVRPFVRIPYIHLPYQLYGLGTGWLSESMQDEIDALHNMRVDGTKLAMLQMYIRRKGSGGLSTNAENFEPLHVIDVDDTSDFQPIKFPGPGYESIQAEMLAKEYNDRANQIPDAQMGFENKAIGTRATAKGTMFLAGQSDRVSSALIENIEEAEAEIGQLLAFQLVRNAEKTRASVLPMLSEGDQEVLNEVLELDVEDIPTVFSFRVQTTDASDAAEAQIEQKMTLFNLYTMYGERMFQTVQIMESPQATPKMKELAAEFFVGGTKFMEEIFRHFKEKSADSYLPFYKDIELMMKQMDMMKEKQLGEVKRQTRQPIEGRSGSGEGYVGQPGMGGLPATGAPAGQGTESPGSASEGGAG